MATIHVTHVQVQVLIVHLNNVCAGTKNCVSSPIQQNVTMTATCTPVVSQCVCDIHRVWAVTFPQSSISTPTWRASTRVKQLSVRSWRLTVMVSTLSQLIASRYVAESITADAKCFGCVGSCQLCTKLFCTQLTKAYVLNQLLLILLHVCSQSVHSTAVCCSSIFV